MKAICKLDVPVDSKAPKPYSQTKEQAVGGPTSLGATSEEGAHPQLSSDMSAFIIIDPVYSASFICTLSLHHDASGMDEGTKNYSFDHIFAGTNPSVLVDKTKSVGDGLKTAHTDLGANEESRADEISKKIKLEDLSNLLKDTRSAFFTPDSPPDEPIIILDESEEEEEVAKDKDTHATSYDVLEDTSVPPPPSLKSAQIQELIAQVAELKTIQWELPAEFLDLPSQELQARNVPSAGQATASPAEGEKNTSKDAKTNLQNELVDLLGIDVVEKYHNKKLLFDKYCDKILKRRKRSKIINCDVLTLKGLISLKVYREDGINEVIENFKVNDLHLAEWKDVVQACPDRKEKGWKTIYGLIKTRMEYLDQTKRELKIDFSIPLKEQDPLIELNELANKKRKRTSDLKDHSKSTKKHKSSSSA
ncbi:hypothetical protein Tco_0024374 [Tanacetum coccineum]